MIEDACHALGAEYRAGRVGSVAHMTVFSFHPVKHLTTGEGGMVTTDTRRCCGDAAAVPQSRDHQQRSAAADGRGSGTMRWCCWGSITGCRTLLARWASATGEAGSESGAAAGDCGAGTGRHFARFRGVVPPRFAKR